MDLGQETLFGTKVIKSVSFNEQEIIRDILYLHCDSKPIECDPTYSIGNFYKKGLTKPKYRFDLKPQVPNVVKSCSTNLPLENDSIKTMMFDPPFLATKGPSLKSGGANNKIYQQYGAYPTEKELFQYSFFF